MILLTFLNNLGNLNNPGNLNILSFNKKKHTHIVHEEN